MDFPCFLLFLFKGVFGGTVELFGVGCFGLEGVVRGHRFSEEFVFWGPNGWGLGSASYDASYGSGYH